MTPSTGMRSALSHCVAKGLTFACFRRPGAPLTLWAQRTPELDAVDGTLLFELNDVFILAPFDLDPERVAFIRSDVELVDSDVEPDTEPLEGCQGFVDEDRSPQASTTEQAYVEGVQRIKGAIATGGLDKAVLSRVMDVPIPNERAIDLFLAALEEHPSAFVAFVRAPGHGTWLGASPERLLAAQDDIVHVDALAGTRQSVVGNSAWGEKERHEQELVTAGVLSTFVSLGLKDVHTVGPETISAGPVQHLRTTVQGDLNDLPLSDVALAIHPTPAVCGAPRDAARAILRGVEQHDRLLYSGFWGPWSADGATDLYVNLRCLQLFRDEASLFVGAGITAGSDAQAEWQETAHKASTWLRLIETLGPPPVSSAPR